MPVKLLLANSIEKTLWMRGKSTFRRNVQNANEISLENASAKRPSTAVRSRQNRKQISAQSTPVDEIDDVVVEIESESTGNVHLFILI